MAYNPYFPATYQPVYQPVQAPASNYVPQQMNQPSSIIWVSGDKEAAMYPIAPNNAVTLWSQSEPVVYLKQADASGKPTMKIYDLVERPENAPVAFSAQGNTQILYATKSDVEALRAELESLKSELHGKKAEE